MRSFMWNKWRKGHHRHESCYHIITDMSHATTSSIILPICIKTESNSTSTATYLFPIVEKCCPKDVFTWKGGCPETQPVIENVVFEVPQLHVPCRISHQQLVPW